MTKQYLTKSQILSLKTGDKFKLIFISALDLSEKELTELKNNNLTYTVSNLSNKNWLFASHNDEDIEIAKFDNYISIDGLCTGIYSGTKFFITKSKTNKCTKCGKCCLSSPCLLLPIGSPDFEHKHIDSIGFINSCKHLSFSKPFWSCDIWQGNGLCSSCKQGNLYSLSPSQTQTLEQLFQKK